MIMNLEQLCTSLELSKRLKEIGLKQSSVLYWTKSGFNVSSGEEHYEIMLLQHNLKEIPEYYISAFTSGELLDILKNLTEENSNKFIQLSFNKSVFAICYCDAGNTPGAFDKESSAECMGKFLENIILNRRFTIEDINARI